MQLPALHLAASQTALDLASAALVAGTPAHTIAALRRASAAYATLAADLAMTIARHDRRASELAVATARDTDVAALVALVDDSPGDTPAAPPKTV